ncbi:TPA: TetR/AcrR family transcriptional regulator [Pseudomonas aeruginosa]|nr:TetR/AcrR family transcriptional regulator [Pseudomonas aeruginosa]
MSRSLKLDAADYLNYDHHMKKSGTRTKDATHERIVEAAARAIRRSGYNGTGVADIMKSAGLTHGGFYAHFSSRDAMLAEAADRAGSEAVALANEVAGSVPQQMSLDRLVRSYLSQEHMDDIETGCPIAALGSEMPRQAPQVRHAATRRIKEMIDVVARQMRNQDSDDAHKEALVTLSTMVGALILARAIDDPGLSATLLDATAERLALASR